MATPTFATTTPVSWSWMWEEDQDVCKLCVDDATLWVQYEDNEKSSLQVCTWCFEFLSNKHCSVWKLVDLGCGKKLWKWIDEDHRKLCHRTHPCTPKKVRFDFGEADSVAKPKGAVPPSQIEDNTVKFTKKSISVDQAFGFSSSGIKKLLKHPEMTLTIDDLVEGV